MFIRLFSSQFQHNSALRLYKHLLRQCQKLPKGPRKHYQFTIQQSFKQYVNESDPERIEEIIRRSYEDCDWILKKVYQTRGKTALKRNVFPVDWEDYYVLWAQAPLALNRSQNAALEALFQEFQKLVVTIE